MLTFTLTLIAVFKLQISVTSPVYYEDYDSNEESYITDVFEPSSTCGTVDRGNEIAGRNGLTDIKRLWQDMYVWIDSDVRKGPDGTQKNEKLLQDVLETIQDILPCLHLGSNLGTSFSETNIHFPENLPYVHLKSEITNGGNCHTADTGLQLSGPTKITLKCPNLKFDTVLHSFLHVLGLVHEHNSPDRDEYIIVHEQNIRGQEAQWKKVSRPAYDTFNQPYNPNSLLHFGRGNNEQPRFDLTKQGKINAVLYNQTWPIRNHPESKLQNTDVEKLRRMYSFHNCNYE